MQNKEMTEYSLHVLCKEYNRIKYMYEAERTEYLRGLKAGIETACEILKVTLKDE